MTTDTDDLVALARECGAYVPLDNNLGSSIVFRPTELAAFAARLRAAPAAQGAGDEPPDGEAERRMDLPSDCEIHAFNCGWRCALSQPAGQQEPTFWIDDPHDIEQGQMLNPEWLKFHNLTLREYAEGARPAEQAQGVSDAPFGHLTDIDKKLLARTERFLTPAQPTAAVREDVVREAVKIMNLVDDYCDLPSTGTRQKLRSALLDALTPAPTEAPTRIETRYDPLTTGQKSY